MGISVPTSILLHHGEVLYVIVMISQRSSNSAIILATKFPLEPLVTLVGTQIYDYIFYRALSIYPSSIFNLSGTS
jgi:hypothetical protein